MAGVGESGVAGDVFEGDGVEFAAGFGRAGWSVREVGVGRLRRGWRGDVVVGVVVAEVFFVVTLEAEQLPRPSVDGKRHRAEVLSVPIDSTGGPTCRAVVESSNFFVGMTVALC